MLRHCHPEFAYNLGRFSDGGLIVSNPIPVKARGIPCFAHVHHFEDELDEYGYTYDLDYTLTDSRDKPVPWIESKMTQRDWDKVDTQIIEYYDSLIQQYLG